jgi:uncharacterized protein (DUF2164 family)
MKIFLLISLSALISCASKPQAPICPEATTEVTLKKSEVVKIQGNVSQFLTDAQITQEHNQESAESIWRFTNMPADSVYYQLGLRDGDAVTKTNLGVQSSSINLISDLSGLATGTTNCLWVMDKDKHQRVIKVSVEKK